MAPSADGALPRVQNFTVHKLLGKGSYGKVYKVQREADGQFYALKEADLGNMSQVERMDAVNEVRLMVSLSHPSVIRYNEAFLSGNKLCTVMEYAPYGDLKYYISKGQRLNAPFPEEAIWRIFLQLCQGLVAIHAANIVHRDLKPANIFMCKSDVLKIGDLGVAKALEKADFAKTQIGTPVYMAPEVWSGKLYSYSSDYWSLGCVLYEMMTFRVPIEARSLPELRAKVSRGRYTPITPGRYSTELVSLCHSLLTVDPKKRPSPANILQSSAAAKWMPLLPNQAASAQPPRRWSDNGQAVPEPARDGLMKTIVVPRDIRQLPRLLPPASYDSSLPPLVRKPSSSATESPLPSPATPSPGALIRKPSISEGVAAAVAAAAPRRRGSDAGGAPKEPMPPSDRRVSSNGPPAVGLPRRVSNTGNDSNLPGVRVSFNGGAQEPQPPPRRVSPGGALADAADRRVSPNGGAKEPLVRQVSANGWPAGFPLRRVSSSGMPGELDGVRISGNGSCGNNSPAALPRLGSVGLRA